MKKKREKSDAHDSCGELPYFRELEPVSHTNGNVQGYSLNFDY
jgi:hypothetical protein